MALPQPVLSPIKKGVNYSLISVRHRGPAGDWDWLFPGSGAVSLENQDGLGEGEVLFPVLPGQLGQCC